MKRNIIVFILSVMFLICCNKKDNNPISPAPPSIAGLWNVDTVHTYFYNAGGSLDSGEVVYPLPAVINYPIYFQFKDDASWLEALVVNLDTSVVTKGTYSYISDTTFDLVYPDATPTKKDELCNILSLTSTSFIFSKQLPTVFNGTEPGFIKYVFRLSK